MDSCVIPNKLKAIIPSVLFILFVFTPSLVLSAGFQEEKLFDGDFYSSEELREKIEIHNSEIQVLTNQIKSLETEIDWMVLKINQIQDSGRKANSNLKKSISIKEKKISNLLKTKERLETLVQYYSALLEPGENKGFSRAKKVKIGVKNITPGKIIPKSQPDSKAKSGASFQPALSGIEQNQIENQAISKSQLQAAINKAGLNDWVEINGDQTCLRIETTLPILFPTGSAKVANEYKSFFQKLAQFLKPYDVKVLVNGYADTVPIHNKKYPSNFELGATRAANIVHQLVDNGLKPSIFQIESTGKYRFASKGMSNQKTLERRAEVTIIFAG
ncbi:MAG: OmpA family protein [Desulfobacula sp.]|nr:OmpA family protein [Desulfobacula sp.]